MADLAASEKSCPNPVLFWVDTVSECLSQVRWDGREIAHGWVPQAMRRSWSRDDMVRLRSFVDSNLKHYWQTLPWFGLAYIRNTTTIELSKWTTRISLFVLMYVNIYKSTGRKLISRNRNFFRCRLNIANLGRVHQHRKTTPAPSPHELNCGPTGLASTRCRSAKRPHTSLKSRHVGETEKKTKSERGTNSIPLKLPVPK